MKTTKLLLSLLLITNLLIVKTQAHQLLIVNDEASYMLPTSADDANLTLTAIVNGSEINVHVSLAGSEGTTGTLKIFNSSSQLITEMQIDLKSLPNYATVNLNEYSAGTYLFELTTSSGVHSSHIIL